MSTNQVPNPQSPAAGTPQPAAMLPPEQVVDQVRVIRSQIAEVNPLTAAQKKFLRARTKLSNGVMQGSINVIGASDVISQGVGYHAEEVRQLVDETNRWTAAEDELKATLNGVAGANLIRRQRVAFIAAQAYGLGSQLARDPNNAGLVPHVQEIKRLKSFKRRKKAQAAPQPPAPAPQTPAHGVAPEPDVTVTEKS
jgi:hypothetical protein